MTSNLRDLATARLLSTYLTDQQSLNEAFLSRIPRGYRDRVHRELQNVLQTATTEIRLSTTLFRRRMADLREERKRRRSFYFELVFGCFLLASGFCCVVASRSALAFTKSTLTLRSLTKRDRHFLQRKPTTAVRRSAGTPPHTPTRVFQSADKSSATGRGKGREESSPGRGGERGGRGREGEDGAAGEGLRNTTGSGLRSVSVVVVGPRVVDDLAE